MLPLHFYHTFLTLKSIKSVNIHLPPFLSHPSHILLLTSILVPLFCTFIICQYYCFFYRQILFEFTALSWVSFLPFWFSFLPLEINLLETPSWKSLVTKTKFNFTLVDNNTLSGYRSDSFSYFFGHVMLLTFGFCCCCWKVCCLSNHISFVRNMSFLCGGFKNFLTLVFCIFIIVDLQFGFILI